MEVSARKPPPVSPPRKYPFYNTESRVSKRGVNIKQSLGVIFWANIAFNTGWCSQFLPRSRGQDSAMADVVCTLPQRSAYVGTTKTLPPESLCTKMETDEKGSISRFHLISLLSS